MTLVVLIIRFCKFITIKLCKKFMLVDLRLRLFFKAKFLGSFYSCFVVIRDTILTTINHTMLYHFISSLTLPCYIFNQVTYHLILELLSPYSRKQIHKHRLSPYSRKGWHKIMQSTTYANVADWFRKPLSQLKHEVHTRAMGHSDANLRVVTSVKDFVKSNRITLIHNKWVIICFYQTMNISCTSHDLGNGSTSLGSMRQYSVT